VTIPPPDDRWTVALYDGEGSHDPIGTGVVVDTNLVLTCAHVACPETGPGPDLWVSFPKAGVGYQERRQVRQCLHNGWIEHHIDLALLELVEPVPPAVTPARLRCLSEKALLNQAWWAFGFPNNVGGASAYGEVTDLLSYGQIYLANQARTGVGKGFSGAAIWSPEYQAVVGLVEYARGDGDGLALTFGHADAQIPEMKLSVLAGWRAEDADEPALAAWGWRLSADAETGRHWSPRARGVAADAETGFRFRGREAALRRLTDWLDRPEAGSRPLILTGSPGVGKSAVLGRVVTTADPAISALLPADDTAVRATLRSVSCAVHAKGKNALEVSTEIAHAAGAPLPSAPVDLVPALRDRLAGRSARFNLVVDALDEMTGPDQSGPNQARRLVRDVLIPLARLGPAIGIQVIVGTRRADGQGDLLAEFGAAAEVVDLDDPAYFAESDLVEYARVTLRLAGAERPANPYAAAAGPVARRIAEFANGNFLVAGLVARARALQDTTAVDPARMTFAGDVGAALEAYLVELPPVGAAPARLALTALAYAEASGLPLGLWRVALEALGGRASDAELERFARASAANFLVETGGTGEPSFRLFHQALNDELRAARPAGDEALITRAWIAAARAGGWPHAPDYLLRFLAEHAARGDLLDDLLTDDGYLLHAHLDRLLRVSEAATSDRARSRARLLLRTPAAFGAPAAERAALFSVVERLDGLGPGDIAAGAPYRAVWAHTPPRQERTVLEGHSQAVYDVCAIEVDGRNLLGSGGEDGTVRLWDPLTNQSVHVFQGHDDCVRGLCAVRVGKETLLATAGHDGSVRLWDPVSGQQWHEFTEHGEWVRNVCTIPAPGGDLLVSAGDDETVRVWDPAAGRLRHTLRGHAGWVTAVAHIPVGDEHLLASTGFDGTVRLWDPRTGEQLRRMTGHEGWATTLYAVTLGEKSWIASAGYDGTVRLWDPRTGAEVWRFATGGPLTDLCTIDSAGGLLLVATGEDGAIRMWEMPGGVERAPLFGHSSWIRAVCELSMSDRRVLATAGDDGTVRLWDPDDPAAAPFAGGRRMLAVRALCAVTLGGAELIASAGSDGTVRLWDPVDGTLRTEFVSDGGSLNDVCAIDDDGRVQLAAACGDGSVRIWDAVSGEPAQPMTEHFESVNAVRMIRTESGPLVASAGEDVTVRLWRPYDRTVRDGLTGHGDWVTALAVVPWPGREALASADKNGTVALWDSDGAALWSEHGHPDAVNALCVVGSPLDPLLASAGADARIRLWEITTGRPRATLTGHTGEVTGVCPIRLGGRDMLVSVSTDRTVRLWDPLTGRAFRTIPVYHPARTCLVVAGRLIIGLDQGLLALSLADQAG
jgi:WD40 repeat protein